MKFILALAACCLPLGASAADLTVRVDEVSNSAGIIRLSVYSSADTFLKKPAWSASAKAGKGAVTITIKDVPEGAYAFSVYHDANENGKLDRNMMGMPTEAYAFSNNATGVMGPPAFEQARVLLPAAGLSAAVSLK